MQKTEQSLKGGGNWESTVKQHWSHLVFKIWWNYTGFIYLPFVVSNSYCGFLNLYHQNRYDKKNHILDLTFDVRPVILYFSFPNLAIFEMRSMLLAKGNEFM